MKISVIWSYLDESSNPDLTSHIKYSEIGDVETIAVFGVQGTNTHAFDQIYILENSTRIERLKYGMAKANGDIIILHHPRSVLLGDWASCLKSLYQAQNGFVWGAFHHAFDRNHWALRFTSWYSNHIRGDLQNVFYLDHCFFLSRPLIKAAMRTPNVAIFEDTLLSKQLAAITPGMRLPQISRTQAIRFDTNGLLRQVILNQYMKLCFYAGRVPEQMNKLYERGLNLNNDYRRPR